MSSLKSINDLNQENYRFRIPSYQRGYRWTSQQIIDLLEDILEFKINEDKTNFYCVQPIIIQKRIIEEEENWIVIDGQQRLTTIYLIMSYIKTLTLINEVKFEIIYDTRKESKEFLENISDDSFRNYVKDKYIDFHFMAEGYETIKKWFEEDRNTASKLAPNIVNKLLHHVKFIWYEIGEDEDPIETFTRINLGKIPLTNSELIKALLLKKDNFDEKDNSPEYIRLKQIEIASEWNIIENNLQENSFWYFINGTEEYETRIEFLFEIVVDSLDDIENIDREYKIFHCINDLYNKKLEEVGKTGAIEFIWKKLKKIYYTLEEWYKDRTIYHYIGFIITEKLKELSEIIKNFEVLDGFGEFKKDEILEGIKDIIRKSMRKDLCRFDYELEDLTYTRNSKLIKRILLLFNIQTLELNDAYYRFPFDLYKKENWDLEHIHAISQDIPSRKDDIKSWLEMIIGNNFLNNSNEGIKIQNRAKKMLEENTILKFEDLYLDVIKMYGVNNDNDGLSNITLLDSETNQSYQNSPFPIKREKIIENDKQGKFIPACTKNVFLKYYSKNVSQMDYWSESDEEDYITAIERTLDMFIS